MSNMIDLVTLKTARRHRRKRMLLLSVIQAYQFPATHQHHHPAPSGEPETLIITWCCRGKPQANQRFSISAPFFPWACLEPRSKTSSTPPRRSACAIGFKWTSTGSKFLWEVHHNANTCVKLQHNSNSSMKWIACKFQRAHNTTGKDSTPLCATLWTRFAYLSSEHRSFKSLINTTSLMPRCDTASCDGRMDGRTGKAKEFLIQDNWSKDRRMFES